MSKPSSSIRANDDDDDATLIHAMYSSLKHSMAKKLEFHADVLKTMSNAAKNMEKEMIKMRYSNQRLSEKLS